MFASFLITFREVLEASLIVATILGILVRIGQHRGVRTVWLATGSAATASIMLVVLGGLFGLKVQEIYSGRVEEIVEGVLMITTALFITWAVFFLHTYFRRQSAKLLAKVKETIEKKEERGLFVLVFVSVFREGFEIVLFLSALFFAESSQSILSGFSLGGVAALLFAFGFFVSARRLPIAYAVRGTNFLLILFAAGLLGRGIHEFIAAGLLPFLERLPEFSLTIIPNAKTSFIGGFLKSMFGITATMHSMQVMLYFGYVFVMTYAVFIRPRYRVVVENTLEQSS